MKSSIKGSAICARLRAQIFAKAMKQILNTGVRQVFIITWALIFMDTANAQTSHTGMRDITGVEITAEMAPGLNLYNTLDAVCWWCDEHNGLESETVWGQPYTTPEMIAAIAERGFKSIRIPVTWFNHMGPAPTYTIDTEWMDRVEEVANYAFDNNLYVIINIHHDDLHDDQQGSWLIPTYEKQDEVAEQIYIVWTQIANRFMEYGDYLIFETMNEPREVGSPNEWNGGTQEHRDVVNVLNQSAVDAIRAAGGNNATRFIMIPQVTATPWAAIQDLEIPNDDPNIIVSAHNYNPYRFCLEEPGVSSWGTTSEKNTLRNEIKEISDHFVKNGRGVVLGEWGALDKNNLSARLEYYGVFAEACKEEGITPMAWFYSFNRNNLTWETPELEDKILDAFAPDTDPPLGGLKEIDDSIIYPNPARGVINFKLTEPAKISIYTMSGKMLKEWDITKTDFQIDLSQYEKGFYQVQLNLKSEVITRKIVIE